MSPSQLCGVSGEECRHLCFPQPGHDQTNARHPLVEMSGDAGRDVVERLRLHAEICKELSDHEAEDDDVIDLDITVRSSDTCRVKQLLLELVHPVGCRTNIEEDHLRISIHQPSSTNYLIPANK